MRSENTINMTYKERLQADYECIRADTKTGTLPLPERLEEIRQATDKYALAHAEDYERAVDKAVAAGRSPGLVPIPFKDDPHIEWLADLILHEDLTDSTPWKIQNTEYPIFSDALLDVKTGRDTPMTAIEKEQERKSVGFRRQRTRYESAFMDRSVKARNKAARKRYLDFVNGKSEGVLNVVIKEEK